MVFHHIAKHFFGSTGKWCNRLWLLLLSCPNTAYYQFLVLFFLNSCSLWNFLSEMINPSSIQCWHILYAIQCLCVDLGFEFGFWTGQLRFLYCLMRQLLVHFHFLIPLFPRHILHYDVFNIRILYLFLSSSGQTCIHKKYFINYLREKRF